MWSHLHIWCVPPFCAYKDVCIWQSLLPPAICGLASPRTSARLRHLSSPGHVPRLRPRPRLSPVLLLCDTNTYYPRPHYQTLLSLGLSISSAPSPSRRLSFILLDYYLYLYCHHYYHYYFYHCSNHCSITVLMLLITVNHCSNTVSIIDITSSVIVIDMINTTTITAITRGLFWGLDLDPLLSACCHEGATPRCFHYVQFKIYPQRGGVDYIHTSQPRSARWVSHGYLAVPEIAHSSSSTLLCYVQRLRAVIAHPLFCDFA